MDNVGDAAVVIGAGYGVLQGLAQFLMLFLPKNTWAFRISKWLVSGPARPVPGE